MKFIVKIETILSKCNVREREVRCVYQALNVMVWLIEPIVVVETYKSREVDADLFFDLSSWWETCT